jgi:tRNA-2-methylthio-N6-dimethylallyladenosine synthase
LSKGLFIKTYGCQMNAYDSARIAAAMATMDYVPVDHPRDASLIVLNTCHIREKAAEKLYSELGRLRVLKTPNAAPQSPVLIVVAGCVAQAEQDEMFDRAPFVDVVVGPQAIHRLPDLVRHAQTVKRPILDTDFPADSKFQSLPDVSQPTGTGVAFITVQEGCDKFCSFCVVPYTRGAEFSRGAAEVIAEARCMADLGAREIVLLGQNVNAYHGRTDDGREWGLARLIEAIAEIKGIDRIRYTTSHPIDMDEALIRAHGDVPKLMPFVHLPVQSGSNRILKAMNRRHTADDYRRLADRMRRHRSDIAIGSDFIVGYPGETDDDFAETLRLVDEVGFAQAYSFKYSARPGTPADLDEQIEENVKNERLTILQSSLDTHQHSFNRACVGRRLDVLFDRHGRKAHQLLGRTPYMQAVHADGSTNLLGTIHPVAIVAAAVNSLSGRISQDSTP